VIFGVGEPLMGKSIVIGSPALTRISFLPSPPSNPLRSNEGFSTRKKKIELYSRE
jgi:hypothetical protein